MAANRVPPAPSVEVNAPVTQKCNSKYPNIVKFKYIWTLDNFSFRGEETGEFIQSPEFSAGTNDDYKKWCLRLYPKGKDKQSKQYLSLNVRLIPESHNKPKVIGKIRLSILNDKQKQTNIQSPKEALHFRQIEGLNFSFPHFVRRDFLEEEAHYLLPDDKLTILCEASIVAENVKNDCEKNITQFEVPESKFFEDFSNLFVNEKFSDVTLLAGGREIKAHKAVLAARSDVFAAMFEHNMEERKLNRVGITDVDHDVLEEMLSFIYTGKASNLEKIAGDLLTAADKYALETLKVMCEKALFDNLSIKTAAETLVLAFLHSSDKLKAQTIDFIKTHIADIVNTNGWQKLTTNSAYSSLLAEIIQILATSLPHRT